MRGYFSGNDRSLWRTLNFNQFPTFSDAIGTSTQKIVYGMGDETQFMYDLTVTLFIEYSSLIFVLLTVPCGGIAHKTWSKPTLLE
jgi:hypothetical protein